MSTFFCQINKNLNGWKWFLMKKNDDEKIGWEEDEKPT